MLDERRQRLIPRSCAAVAAPSRPVVMMAKTVMELEMRDMDGMMVAAAIMGQRWQCYRQEDQCNCVFHGASTWNVYWTVVLLKMVFVMTVWSMRDGTNS
jgi:hypothetical protein